MDRNYKDATQGNGQLLEMVSQQINEVDLFS